HPAKVEGGADQLPYAGDTGGHADALADDARRVLDDLERIAAGQALDDLRGALQNGGQPGDDLLGITPGFGDGLDAIEYVGETGGDVVVADGAQSVAEAAS